MLSWKQCAIPVITTVALCTWAHNIRLHIACTNEPKSAQQAKQGA